MTNDAPPRYAIDTSTLMRIADCANPDPVWSGIDELATSERLFTVRIVFDELSRNDKPCYDRLHRHYGAIVVPDTELWATVGPIAYRHQRMSKPFASRDKADASIVALAVVHGLTVVCEERNDGPTRERSMAYVCELEGVPCISLADLIANERF